MKPKRDEFFAMIDEVRERNQDTPPEVIEAEVEECVREARLTRRTLEQTDAGENQTRWLPGPLDEEHDHGAHCEASDYMNSAKL